MTYLTDEEKNQAVIHTRALTHNLAVFLYQLLRQLVEWALNPTVAVLAVAVAGLEQGTLSPYVAASLPDPEYQTARALGYLEPVAAAALTMGWFSVASVLFASAADIAQKSGISQRLSYVLVWGTGLPLIVFEWQLPAPFLMGLSAFLWCFTPFFQNLKKVKNSA